MGRHAAEPPPDDPAGGAAGVAPDAAVVEPPAGGMGGSAPAPVSERRRGWLREGLVLAVVVALATGAVLAWTVGTAWVAVLGAIGSAVVVIAASWVARSVPGPGRSPSTTP